MTITVLTESALFDLVIRSISFHSLCLYRHHSHHINCCQIIFIIIAQKLLNSYR